MTPCAQNPARWADARRPDAEAQQLCRTACAIRRECLRRATAPGPTQGIWGGVFLPSREKHSRQWANAMASVRHSLAILSNEEVA